MSEQSSKHKETETRRSLATPSFVLSDGTIGEMIYDGVTTSFAVYTNGSWSIVDRFTSDDGDPLIPYSPQNNLIKHRVVLFPSAIQEYRDEQTLITDVQAFIHRYVDVSPLFERLAADQKRSVFLSSN